MSMTSRGPAGPQITRHFLTIGDRRVHYTRAGEGAPVLMLHASPCSTKVLQYPQRVFAERFTALAFDTPGFGLSDQLPMAQPRIEDFADALAEAMDALDIAEAATYGRHTGAGIAVEFARRHPDRCTMAFADGYPVFPTPYSEERLAEYLAPIVPRWDGGHLLWLWFRYRDQHAFWPWDKQDAAHRSDADVPDEAFLHRGVLELIEAGDGYRIGYAAAFRHEGLGLLPDLKKPVCFAARPGDSMFSTLPLFPADAWVEEMPRENEPAALAERTVLLRHQAPGRVPRSPACAPIAGRTTPDFLDLPPGQIFFRAAGSETDRTPILLIPDVPGTTALHDDLILALSAERRCLAFDLPGLGESDLPPGPPISIAFWAGRLQRALDRLGVDTVHLVAIGAGAAVAAAIATDAPGRVKSLTLQSPPILTEAERTTLAPRYAPNADPVWDGSHLLRVWHHLRDQELWWPWFDRRHATARATPRIDPAALHLRVRECLKQPGSYQPAITAALAYPLAETLARLRLRPRILTHEADLFHRFATRLKTPPTPCSDDTNDLAAAILAGLG